MRWDNALWLLSSGDVRPERDRALAGVVGDFQRERSARMIVPYLDGINAMPVRAFA